MTERTSPTKNILPRIPWAAVSTFLAWLIGQAGPFQDLESRSLDWRFLLRGAHGPRSEEIVLVLVEEEAPLAYRSPIPRDHLAQVIERLGMARLVGLDIFLDKLYSDTDGNQRLRRALEENGRVIAVSMLEPQAEERFREIVALDYFCDAMLDIGYAAFHTAPEVEKVRRGSLVKDTENGWVVSLAGALYLHSIGIDPDSVRAKKVTHLPDGRSMQNDLLIHYSGPPNNVYRRSGKELFGGFTVCPSHLVANGVYPPVFFKDKIVLIGAGLEDAPDRFRTPYFADIRDYQYEMTFGVEIHAHFLQTLLSDSNLDEWNEFWTLFLTLGLALLVTAAVLYTDVVKSLLGALVLMAALWVWAFGMFNNYDVVVPVLTPSLGILMAYGLATAYYARTEGRQRRQTRQLFEKYLAPAVVEELLEDPSNWKLDGKIMDITVMFADLEGFTPLSERLEPEQLVRLINEYLNEMTAIILAEGGTIDKYEGDLVMAFFGAPLPLEGHAFQACQAALRMQARLEELRHQWSGGDAAGLRVRIGLHSGPAVVGNMGSDFRFNYTAMGDTVNLASRLEGANKDFGTYLMISEATRQQAGEGAFHYRSLGEITVKGKSKATSVYEVLPLDDGEAGVG
jgi:class 3 adenylate cyclase/CHASE2 domain-containing sensor protein